MEKVMQSIKNNNECHMPGAERRLAIGLYPAVLAVALWLPSLAAQAQDPEQDKGIQVTIIFDDKHCPIDVKVPEPSMACEKGPDDTPCLRRGKDYIVWSAVLEDGSPMKEGFSIYFDPFKGKSMEAPKHQSTIKSNKVDEDAPEVSYKYTVVGTKCPEHPLDPNIRVRR
jgi:hypothetical protein